MTTLTIDLPDILANDATAAGLLAPDTIEAMPGENRRHRAAADLFAAADKLAAARLPPMSLEEIQPR